MPTTKQTTKKVAPVKKVEAKTTTPKTEAQPTVVEVAEYKNPMILEDLYTKQKMSAGAIARQYGVSRGVVLHHMRKAGITITTRKVKSSDAKSQYRNANWLRKALEAGESIYSIAKSQKVSYTSVRMQALKLQPMPAGNKATPKKKTATIKK